MPKVYEVSIPSKPTLFNPQSFGALPVPAGRPGPSGAADPIQTFLKGVKKPVSRDRSIRGSLLSFKAVSKPYPLERYLSSAVSEERD